MVSGVWRRLIIVTTGTLGVVGCDPGSPSAPAETPSSDVAQLSSVATNEPESTSDTVATLGPANSSLHAETERDKPAEHVPICVDFLVAIRCGF
jgi:hypothetical protein